MGGVTRSCRRSRPGYAYAAQPDRELRQLDQAAAVQLLEAVLPRAVQRQGERWLQGLFLQDGQLHRHDRGQLRARHEHPRLGGPGRRAFIEEFDQQASSRGWLGSGTTTKSSARTCGAC